MLFILSDDIGIYVINAGYLGFFLNECLLLLVFIEAVSLFNILMHWLYTRFLSFVRFEQIIGKIHSAALKQHISS